MRLRSTMLVAGCAAAVIVAASAIPALAAPRDRNHDGIPDPWEAKYRLSIKKNQASADPDKDGLTNLQEYQAGTNPRLKDSNHNGVTDAHEDADHDGVDNAAEFVEGTNPRMKDSDHDGVSDGHQLGGVITSFDATSGMLTITPFRHGSATVTVTVDASTTIQWKQEQHRGAPATAADLVAGAVVQKIRVATQPDGSLHALRIYLRKAHESAVIPFVAKIESYDASSSVLTLESRWEDDTRCDVVVDEGTTFAWAPGVVADHDPGVADLVEDARVVQFDTRTADDGSLHLTSIVLVPSPDQHEGDDDHQGDGQGDHRGERQGDQPAGSRMARD